MIHVLAIITAKSGMRESVLKLFHANIPAVRAEKGCIEYGPAVDAEGVGGIQTRLGPDSFVVVEKWESVDALKAHAVAPHMAAYGARTKEMVASRVIHVLSPA
jgi:quinol monooxygenase YgiN